MQLKKMSDMINGEMYFSKTKVILDEGLCKFLKGSGNVATAMLFPHSVWEIYQPGVDFNNFQNLPKPIVSSYDNNKCVPGVNFVDYDPKLDNSINNLVK